ncbi:MAG: bifunctional histidinol-phosphatase/imidazoleglycerol-phosphate dehydratase HisB [Bacteroidales bacterium]|nr:bifunctional histidinol-phosphatase/imidazoleglycerol-phosphate dehydratase HisB [Bacteroidales bacterium]MBN2633427.1 bifunctional histidinol-phosphatase/imidazoleglycerol-phosphate dehydratase HisB [Bacteroidales bacterium]
MKKVLFIDRDGTVLREPEDKQIDSLEKLMFIPGAITALSGIAAETDFEMVMVTNQDGLGTTLFPEETFWPAHNKMTGILEGEGVRFREVFIDKSLPAENAPTRKPGTAMLVKYLASGVDMENSYVIGDRYTDIEFARNLGCRVIFFSDKRTEEAVLSTTDWNEIRRFLLSLPRKAEVKRKTGETDITVELNLDGSGKSNINTGIAFFDHMLDQIARHGNFDLSVRASGDRGDDGHHLIEDTAICLGDAFGKALGSKKGIERYSFVLPMDDCLAQVAIDLGGRAWLVWDVAFSQGKIGEMPTEMFYHFFKSFSDNAKCNLNMKAEGDNEHHKIEALFKAFAKALKKAAEKTAGGKIPSTKGQL